MKTIDWVACERLIGNLASKFHQDSLELDDLKQEARLAVIESHGDYTPEMGISLSTFIGRRIRDALRKHVSANVDAFEVSREWVAESIADGPDKALRAKSKAECNALRDVVGPDKFRKPRRVIETVRATVSLDDNDSSSGDEEESCSLHERIGTGPEQEAALVLAQTTKWLDAATDAASKHGGDGLSSLRVIQLRTQGYSFAEIGTVLQKSEAACKMLWSRAQKRLSKKRAA